MLNESPNRLPQHPAVDWSTLRLIPGTRRSDVLVKCPGCPTPRRLDASLVRSRINSTKFNFTGTCIIHKELQRRSRLPRPAHPAVEWNNIQKVKDGTGYASRVPVTCPKCSRTRLGQTGSIAAHIRNGRFTGLCLPCSPNAQKREWKLLGPGRRIDPVKGYIRLTAVAIAPSEMHLYEGMKGKLTFVLEHRMVMARTLGRPLTSNELVDHRDGIKTNNDPENLRLYRRGKNDDGSGCGYGTFYDEWQRAEAEVRRLRAQA